jgi:hypothetical protein
MRLALHDATDQVTTATAPGGGFDRCESARAGWAPAEIPEAGLFMLPGGYVSDDGALHRDVKLSPLTGRLEELLADASPDACSASVVSDLLTLCVERVGTLPTINAELVRGLLVGDREYLLVRLRQMAFGSEVEAVWHCENSNCRKPMDISFSIADMVIERKTAPTRFFTHRLSAHDFDIATGEGGKCDNCEVEFRLPTGADQEALAAVFHVDHDAAVDHLLARCVRRIGEGGETGEASIAQLTADARQEIGGVMGQLAPQIAIELDLTCPECQTSFVANFDFTAFFLAEMKGNLYWLEREVHLLALYYHWSEREILSLPRKKRRRYIQLLQEEIERLNQFAS